MPFSAVYLPANSQREHHEPPAQDKKPLRYHKWAGFLKNSTPCDFTNTYICWTKRNIMKNTINSLSPMQTTPYIWICFLMSCHLLSLIWQSPVYLEPHPLPGPLLYPSSSLSPHPTPNLAPSLAQCLALCLVQYLVQCLVQCPALCLA